MPAFDTVAVFGPDNRFSVAAGGNQQQSITVPGTAGQTCVLTGIVVFAEDKGRIDIDFTDRGEKFTRTPVDTRFFDKEFNPLPLAIELASGSEIQVTIYNDGTVDPADFTVVFIGIVGAPKQTQELAIS